MSFDIDNCLETFFSRSKSMAKPRINIIQVDLVIVYKEIVINSKLQLDKPMSKALATPGAANLRTYTGHDNVIRETPVILLYNIRINDDNINLTTIWQVTTVSG